MLLQPRPPTDVPYLEAPSTAPSGPRVAHLLGQVRMGKLWLIVCCCCCGSIWEPVTYRGSVGFPYSHTFMYVLSQQRRGNEVYELEFEGIV